MYLPVKIYVLKQSKITNPFDIDIIPVGEIEKAEFSFTLGEDRPSYVFPDDIVLVSKK